MAPGISTLVPRSLCIPRGTITSPASQWHWGGLCFQGTSGLLLENKCSRFPYEKVPLIASGSYKKPSMPRLSLPLKPIWISQAYIIRELLAHNDSCFASDPNTVTITLSEMKTQPMSPAQTLTRALQFAIAECSHSTCPLEMDLNILPIAKTLGSAFVYKYGNDHTTKRERNVHRKISIHLTY